MSVGREVARMAERQVTVEATTATYLGVEGERAKLVTAAGESVLASKATTDWPVANEPVWLLTVDGQRLMLGSPGGSSWGVVDEVRTGEADVEYPVGTGELVTYRTARGASLQLGDTVLLDRARGFVIAAWAPVAAPTPSEPPAPLNPSTVVREAEVNVAWDGTVQSNGYWLPPSDLLYTRNLSGAANYATMGYDLSQRGISADSLTEAAVYLSLDKVGGPHTAGTHDLGGRSGTPSPANTFPVTPASGWLTVPLAAAQAIVSGEASGLTFYGGAGTVYRSARANPGNGRLRLRYRVEA